MCLGDLDEQSIYGHRQEIKSIVVNMLQNWSHTYYSYNSNIKYIGSTIKCINFKLIHYAIDLDVVSLFMVFNDFDSMFLSMSCYFESMKLFFFLKKILYLIKKNSQNLSF